MLHFRCEQQCLAAIFLIISNFICKKLFICLQLITCIFSVMVVTIFCLLCMWLGAYGEDLQLFYVSIAFVGMSTYLNVLVLMTVVWTTAVTSTVNMVLKIFFAFYLIIDWEIFFQRVNIWEYWHIERSIAHRVAMNKFRQKWITPIDRNIRFEFFCFCRL